MWDKLIHRSQGCDKSLRPTNMTILINAYRYQGCDKSLGPTYLKFVINAYRSQGF